MYSRLTVCILGFLVLRAANGQAACATLNCGLESAQCMLEPACREITGCILGCKGDMGCEYLCGTEQYSPANIAMTKCLQEHGCLPHVNDTTTPDDFTHRLDSLQTVPFSQSDMEGQWWINYGLNYALDCVPCQSVRISADPKNSSLYSVNQKFRSFKNRIWNYVDYPALFNANDAAKGILPSHYAQAGFSGKDAWYILGFDGDEMTLAYLADSNWATHGVFIMTRGANRVVSNPEKWRAILEKNQIHWNNLCHADVTSPDCTEQEHAREIYV